MKGKREGQEVIQVRSLGLLKLKFDTATWPFLKGKLAHTFMDLYFLCVSFHLE